jgi:acyl carrier protein
MALPPDYAARVVAAIRDASRAQLPERIEPGHALVRDLGFDSMTIAMLTLALEEQFDCPILLEGWIATSGDPSSLTVSSLAEYIRGVLSEN